MTHDVDETSRHPGLAVVALCFGGLLAALTQTMVIPIQGELPLLLHTSASNATWVVTITLLTAAVTMPITGRLADMLGKQRILLASAVILLVGSVVSALSTTLLPMLIGRGLQGLAMGFIPVGIALLREIVPPHLAATAVAAMSATLGVGGAIGLPLSAWIVEVGNWHTLFWVSAAVAAFVLLAIAFLVPHVHDATPARFDIHGAVGLAGGLVLLLVGLSKASAWGWGSGRTLGLMAAGLVILLVWARVEMRTRQPLVDMRATLRRPVLLTNLAAAAIGMGMMAQAIVVPQLLELPKSLGYGLGQSILEAGLWMAPGGLMMMLFAPVSSRLINGIGAKRTLMIGAAILGAGYVVAFALTSTAWQLMVATIVISIGVGIGYAAMPTLVMDASPAHEAGSAVGINTLMRSFGTTVASALMGTLLTTSTHALGPIQVPSEGAFKLCFLIGAAAAFIGVAITAVIPRVSAKPHDGPQANHSDAADVLVAS